MEGSPFSQYSTNLVSWDNVEDRINLLTSIKWCDLVIVCAGVVFNVHRQIIYGQSKFFDGLIDALDTTNGSRTVHVEGKPLVIGSVIWYMYAQRLNRLDFPVICSFSDVIPAGEPTFFPIALLYEIRKFADQINYKSLQHLTFRSTAKCLREHGIESNTSLDMGGSYFADELQSLAMSAFTDDNAGAKGDPNSRSAVKELLGWAFYFMSVRTSHERYGTVRQLRQQQQTPEARSTWVASIPQLAHYRWRTAMILSKQPTACLGCQKLLDVNSYVRHLTVRCEDGTFAVIYCVCGWRGFCTETCLTRESWSRTPDLTPFRAEYCYDCCLEKARNRDAQHELRDSIVCVIS